MGSKKPLQLLREHWRIILACLALGLGGALLVTVVMPKTYTATATVYVSAVPGTDANALLESGHVPTIPHDEPDTAADHARALFAGGARVVEFLARADTALAVFETIVTRLRR